MTLNTAVPTFTGSKLLIVALENNRWGSLHTGLLLKQRRAARPALARELPALGQVVSREPQPLLKGTRSSKNVAWSSLSG